MKTMKACSQNWKRMTNYNKLSISALHHQPPIWNGVIFENSYRLYHSTVVLHNDDGNNKNEDVEGKYSKISSSRAGQAVKMLPTYLADARAVQKYSPQTPQGALQLSVAENQMMEDILIPELMEMYSTQGFPPDAIYYQPTQGRADTRAAMADYLQELLQLDRPMDVDGIVVGAGCNAVLENLCISLAEPGEGVMIPTPYYAAFEFDLGSRAGLPVVPVTTMDHQEVGASSSSLSATNDKTDLMSLPVIPERAYYPNRASLDAAMARSIRKGIPPRILLLCHPQNPLGICYPPNVVMEIIDWCRENQIHLISDEIYAGSIYRPKDANFVSTLKLASTSSSSSSATTKTNNTKNNSNHLGVGPYIHLVYAMSKDFCLSGLRVGAMYSENLEIRLPMQKLNDLCSVSSQTQLLVERMLTIFQDGNHKNLSWTKRFMAINHERLQERGNTWQTCLQELNIPFLHGTAGLFVWMDFREFLPTTTTRISNDTEEEYDQQERTLYLELMHDYGLLFTPGRSMKNELPGFFRCVFTAASDEEFQLGMERLQAFVHSKRGV